MLFLAALAAAASAPVQFDVAHSITSALGSADYVAAADFDQDGDQDVVVASRAGSALHYFEGLGGGAFARPRAVDTGGTAPLSVHALDIDGDGFQDLVLVGAIVLDGLSSLRGQGDGTFAPAVPLGSIGRHGQDIEARDLDGDGDLDLLVPTGGAFGAWPSVVQNLGGGVLAPPAAITFEWAQSIASFDGDGDGDLDLVMGMQGGFLRAFRNDGVMGFTDLATIDTFSTVEWMDMVDLDGDGDDDLVAFMPFVDELRVYENLGGFAFANPVAQVLSPSAGAWRSLVDVDLDGDLDVVVAPSVPVDGWTLGWFENLGGLTLAPRADLSGSLPSALGHMESADVTGDGLADLLLARRKGDLLMLRSDPAAMGPKFESELEEITTRLSNVTDVAVLDVDADGDNDIVSASPVDGLALAMGRGFDSFGVPVPFAPGVTSARRLAPSDMDGDGRADLLVQDRVGRLTVLWNEPTGPFSQAPVGAGPQSSSGSMELADIDEDGDLDIVTLLSTSSVVAYDQTSPRTFSSARPVAASTTAGRELLVLDLDLDAHLDLVLLEHDGSSQVPRPDRVRWFQGAGNGTFTDMGILFEMSEPAADLTALSFFPSSTPAFYWIGRNTESIGAATLDVPSGLWVQGTAPQGLGGAPQLLELANLDKDMPPGLLVCASGGTFPAPDILRFFDRAGAGFSPPAAIDGGFSLCSVMRATDLDSDGDEDLLLAYDRTGQLLWIPNLACDDLGVNYCGPAAPGSSGAPAELVGYGSPFVADNDLTLRARSLSPGTTTLFIASQSQGLVPTAGGGLGTLCLGGSIGRFTDQIQPANPDGVAVLHPDLTALPQPTGTVPGTSGSIWFFQAWFRDSSGGVLSSNFTDGLAVVLR